MNRLVFTAWTSVWLATFTPLAAFSAEDAATAPGQTADAQSGAGTDGTTTSASARADKRSDPEAQWTPSLAVTVGLYAIDYIAAIESSVRPSKDGSDPIVTPFVGGLAELMSPAVDLPGQPRFFVQAELAPSFGQDVTVANEGALGELIYPPPSRPTYEEQAIQGVGADVRVETQSLGYGARVGVAFSTRLENRRVRLKPSVGWWRHSVRILGQLQHVERLVNTGPNRIIRLDGVETRSYNSIGPGLELEIELEKTKAVGISAFVFANGHYILNDRNSAISVSNDAGDSAKYSYKTDSPWIYRMAVGVRVHWLGL